MAVGGDGQSTLPGMQAAPIRPSRLSRKGSARTRFSDVMGPTVKNLTDEQIEALAQYLTSF
ncbi:MAG: hypothetical protein HY067_18130 [Betaproteobacteria bacterium]|nr:hypothetical protein [Betaproteobacteria bacterium]